MKSEIEKIATEVSPTAFITPEPEVVKVEKIINDILSLLDYESIETFKEGQAKQGRRQLSSLDILKDALLKEVESVALTKAVDADQVERVINSKTKKLLTAQINNIFEVLSMSTVKRDNRYYILGLILRLLLTK